MSLPDPKTLHEAYGRELTGLVHDVVAGDLVTDRTSIERQVVRVVGTLVWLQQRHQVDDHGRCSTCRAAPRAWWRPWPKRIGCTVHAALSFHLRQPDQFVLAAITDNAREAS